MLSKPPYPSYNRYVLALQGHEQMVMTKNEEHKDSMNHEHAYFTHRGRRRNRGGRFHSRGCGFTPVGRFLNTTGDPRQNVHTKTGNFKSNFSYQPPSQQKTKNSEGIVICQICNKANHSALDCWKKFDYSYQAEKIPQALVALALNEEENDPTFYVDSRATTHITINPGKMTQITPYKGNDAIFVGNGEALRISHIGETRLKTKHGDLKLKNLLVVPEIKKNLLPIGQLISDNLCYIEFSSTGFVIKDQFQKVVARGTRKGGLYALKDDMIQVMTYDNY